jgi:N-formylglutamate deformylase
MTMKRRFILHVPHSSNHIPLRKGYTVSDELIEAEILKLTDWYTEDLFHSNDLMVIAPFSRVFCDTERFADDTQEVMSKVGMGVCYERSDDGSLLRQVSKELKNTILQNYYWKHHNKLRVAVEKELKVHHKALILDCHSFPSTPFVRDLDQTYNRPDFNIGTDSFHTSIELIELSEEFFNNRGLSMGIDAPYAGTIVPMNFYGKDSRVMSIMLEVNRKLYLDEPTNQRSENYENTKQIVQEYIQTLQTFLNN